MAKTYFPFGYWPPKYLPGWYWANLSHGHRVYRGVGGLSGVDFDTPVGFAQAGAETVTLTGLGHEASTRYTYAARPVAGNGWLETPDVSNTCEMVTDSNGDWVGTRPAPVQWLEADVQDGGDIELRWTWQRPYGQGTPEGFNLYCSTAPGIEPGSPEATEPFTSSGGYCHTFHLADGQSYWFAVTARTANGVESGASRVIGPITADATAPGAPAVTVRSTY